MTDYPITELCKLSKQIDHESIDGIIISLKKILEEEDESNGE